MRNEWFMGFLEGEGSFINSPRKASKNNNKYYPRFQLSITQKEYKVLERIKDFLNIKNIKSKIYPEYDKWILHIQDKESLFYLCNLLDSQEWFTDTKYRQYQEWKIEIIKWFESGYNKRQYKLVEEMFALKADSRRMVTVNEKKEK